MFGGDSVTGFIKVVRGHKFSINSNPALLSKEDDSAEEEEDDRWRSNGGHLPQSKSTKDQFQKRREKSTVVLVLIVVIFIICHSYRLSLKVYEFVNPDRNTGEHLELCYGLGRYHIPVALHVLVSLGEDKEGQTLSIHQ